MCLSETEIGDPAFTTEATSCSYFSLQMEQRVENCREMFAGFFKSSHVVAKNPPNGIKELSKL